MPVESWTRPEDVPTLAAEAMVQIDAVLTRLDAAGRDAFWASIAKCYNTPYNDPKPRSLVQVSPIAAPECGPAAESRPAADDETAVALAAIAAITHSAAFGPDHLVP